MSAQNMAVQVVKTNLLYVGIPNDMHIVVNDVPPERLILLPSMGKIDTIDLKSGHYKWTICKKDSSVAQLVLADSVRTNPIDTLFFRVAKLPEPQFRLVHPRAHSMGGIVALYDSPEFHFMEDTRIIVVGFDLCYYPKKSGSDPVQKHNSGARFGAEVQNLYNRALPGDRYRFFNFQWKIGCDETIRKSGDALYFELK